MIATNLGRHMPGFVYAVFRGLGPLLALKSVAQGAATQCYVAVNPGALGESGRYFADCNPAQTSAYGRDDALAEALWERTEEIVAELA